MDNELKTSISEFFEEVDPYEFADAIYDNLIDPAFWNCLQEIIDFLQEIAEEENEYADEAEELIKKVQEVIKNVP